MVGGGSPACSGSVHMCQTRSYPDLGRLGFQGIGEAHRFVFKEPMVLILWRVEVGGKGGRIHQHVFPYKVESSMCCKKATDWLCGDRGEGEVVKFTLLMYVRCCACSFWPMSPGQADQHDCVSNHTPWSTEWSLNHRVVWEYSLGTGRIVAICCLGCLRTHPGRPRLSWKCLQKPRQADQIPALQCSFLRNH